MQGKGDEMTSRFESAAREYADKIALPFLRSMWPSQSRGSYAKALSSAFLAGTEHGALEILNIIRAMPQMNNQRPTLYEEFADLLQSKLDQRSEGA
jgi:hypothetical protein